MYISEIKSRVNLCHVYSRNDKPEFANPWAKLTDLYIKPRPYNHTMNQKFRLAVVVMGCSRYRWAYELNGVFMSTKEYLRGN